MGPMKKLRAEPRTTPRLFDATARKKYAPAPRPVMVSLKFVEGNPLPRACGGVTLPRLAVVPHSNHAVVAKPTEPALPLSVALVGVTPLSGNVVASRWFTNKSAG